MKKLILFAAILFAGVSVVKAEAPTHAKDQNKGTTTLKVELKTIQSIIVNSDANLTFSTMSHYADATSVKSGMIPNHLNIYTTGGYEVSVYHDNTDELFDYIQVAVYSSEATDGDTPIKAQSLTSTAAAFFNRDYNKDETSFAVQYSGLANFDFKSKLDNGDTSYESVITYTIAPN